MVYAESAFCTIWGRPKYMVADLSSTRIPCFKVIFPECILNNESHGIWIAAPAARQPINE